MEMTAPLRAALQAAAAAGLLALCLPLHALTFQGTVTHVTDGDSLWIRPAAGGSPRAIRLQGIDAPEICQVFGRQAREALAARALQRQVTVNTRARDRYERLLARVSIGSQDLGGWMVAQGYAWSDGFRGRGGPYARQQEQARGARLGLWSGAQPMPPRQFRRRHGRCR